MKKSLKEKKLSQDINVLISQAYSLNTCKDKLQEKIEALQTEISIEAIEENNRLANGGEYGYTQIENDS